MRHDLSNPYNCFYHTERGYYTFETDNGLAYQVYFTDGSGYFEEYPEIAHYFLMFGFLVLEAKEALPDKRVWATIYHILADFFAKNDKALIFVCDTKDDKQAQRQRLFDVWYKKLSFTDRKDIEKIDMILETEDVKLFTSLLVSNQHIDYQSIRNYFIELHKNYQDKLTS